MNMKYRVSGVNRNGEQVSYYVIGDSEEINHLCWCKALIRGIADNYTQEFVEWSYFD